MTKRVNKTIENLKTVWQQLDNASGELYNAQENLARMVNLPKEVEGISDRISVDINQIDSLKNHIEEMIKDKQ